MILVIKGKKILCGDKMWREFSSFGTFPSCFKIWKRLSRAIQIARSQNAHIKYRDQNATELCAVAVVPEGHTVNAVGDVFNTEDVQVGNLSNFTVPLD